MATEEPIERIADALEGIVDALKGFNDLATDGDIHIEVIAKVGGTEGPNVGVEHFLNRFSDHMSVSVQNGDE